MRFPSKIDNRYSTFRLLSILIMGKLFLPIVFENLPFPFSSIIFYFILYLGAVFIYFPTIYTQKTMLYFYSIMAVFYLFIISGFYKINLQWLYYEFSPFLLSLIIYKYFIRSGDWSGLKMVLRFTLIFIIITTITSIVGLLQYPMAARYLAGKLANEGNWALIDYYTKIGIAGYGFYHGLAFSIPLFIAYFKEVKAKKKERLLYLGLIVLFLGGIIMSQYTSALVIAAVGIFMAIFGSKKFKRSIFILIIIMTILVILPKDYIADSVLFTSENIRGDALKSRLLDMSVTLNESSGETETHMDRRAARIPYLLSNFLESPFYGSGKSSGHVYWLDILSRFGILGILPLFLLIKYQIMKNFAVFSEPDKIYYVLSMILFIALGFMKNMGGNHMMMFTFFFIPAIFLLRKQKINLFR